MSPSSSAASASARRCGSRKGAAEFSVSARHAIIAPAALLVLASGVLVTAFLTHGCSIAYVVAHSSRDVPKALVGAACYSGRAGSLLYWATTLGLPAPPRRSPSGAPARPEG